MNPRYYFDFSNIDDVDGCNALLWENMEVEITNPMEIQEGDDEEIPLVRDDVEPDIVDVDIVDTNLVDANLIQDNNDENDEHVVRGDDEDDFSNRELDIDSFDRDPEDDESDDSSGTRKHRPTRGLKSLCEKEQNPNVKAFTKITADMERVVGKNANRLIGECSKWVKEFYPLDSRLKEEHFAEKTITQAISNKPLEVHKNKWDWPINNWADPKQHISEKNRVDRLREKIKPANGAKSTARIYHDEIIPSLMHSQDSSHMKEKPGSHRGLGPTPQPPRKRRGQSTKMRVEATAKIQQLQQKEASLQGQFEEL
ncbi:hypothetical protein Cgig2_000955 [Carnegiea gigantea]|uniref:Uncharacterized protein n=1 Tax=Carnegiea gigantea TaxID=171969 RepID=A0A9Q1KLE5_9CARY|nr:hypothetical protein Cgig2_000955 [Carnegiea gigantea]